MLKALGAQRRRVVHVSEICRDLKVPVDARESVLEVLRALVESGDVHSMPGQRFRLRNRPKGRGTNMPGAPKPRSAVPSDSRSRSAVPSDSRSRSAVPNDSRPRSATPSDSKARSPMPGARTAQRERRPHSAPRPRSASHADSWQFSGRLHLNPRGFGFVAPEEGGPDAFIAPPSIGSAMHGDRVEVRAWRSVKGIDGEIVGMIERANPTLTGHLRYARRDAYFEPDDPRYPSPLAVEGEVPKSIDADTVVCAKIARYPKQRDDRLVVTIVDVLGLQGQATVEVAKIKVRDGIQEEFTEEVIEEASRLPQRLSTKDRKGREDLRGYDLVTIDPPDARDHDDAVWAERLPDGGFRLIIAIADVSHYVPEGSALDKEALARGCSIYLPSHAIPMLPGAISSHMASLVPQRDRLCLAVDVELGPRGAIRKHRYIEGVMRSQARLTYGGVARALGLSKEATQEKEAEKRLELLRTLFDASRHLRRLRMQRGSLEFDLPEARVLFTDESGEPNDIVRRKGDDGVKQAYQLIEEMMLLANEVVATDFVKRGLPAMFRVHGKPDVQKLAAFVETATALGFPIDVDEAQNPRILARFLRKIQKHPKASILHWLLLRAMQQASYDTENIGHFGLASRNYLHFTSPIRRYPDLVVHRLVKRFLRGERIDPEKEGARLRRQAKEASRLERRAMVVERDVLEVYRVLTMRAHLGEEIEATITGVEAFGFFASLDAPFVDVTVPIERLSGSFSLDRLGTRLQCARSGRSYALGDRVRLRIEDANLTQRKIFAAPAEVLQAPAPKSAEEGKDEGRDLERQLKRQRRSARQKEKKKARRLQRQKEQRATTTTAPQGTPRPASRRSGRRRKAKTEAPH